MYEDNDIYQFNIVATWCRYYNDESAYGVYTFTTNDNIPYYSTYQDENDPGITKKVSTLAGKMQELTVGGEYLVKATHKYNDTYGHQYNPIAIYAVLPQSKESQLLFLKSLIPVNIAENLLEAYPNVVEDVANGTLKEIDYKLVKGVREATWVKIKDKILNNYLISDIITMLKPIGVTYTMIKKLLDDEPNPMLLKKQLEENPYILTKIPRLGFKRIDELALKLKPELISSTERLVAFTKYYFTEMGEEDGHTWCSLSIYKSAVSNNVPECADKVDWLLGNKDFVHIEDDKIGLQYYYNIEMRIYDILRRKLEKKIENIYLTDEQIDIATKHAEEEQGFEYVPEQIEVIKKSLNRNISIITGKAGTGKTSIMRAIIKAYTENFYSVSASALSAMAAQRITEATSYPAMTIHRTLGARGFNEFTYNKDNHMIINVAFLDEGSMVNASLFLHWLEAIGDNTRIIISGDHKQLPPIGFGNIFSDLIDLFDDSIVSKLTKPMRQAEMSGILVDANLIRDNINPITEKLQPKLVHGKLTDMYYMFRDNRQSLFNIAIKTYVKSIETDGIDNVAIIVPRKKDCLNSTNEINKTIQNMLLGNVKEEISNRIMTFKLGAKVMQTVNDYDRNVFNGEVGYITEINEEYDGKKKEKYCIVTFLNDKKVVYHLSDLLDLDLAYALTCHKCQGSGISTVISIIDNTHYQLLDNCMLYTMLTRAKKKCLLLAEPQAFLQCIRRSHNNRNTWLALESKKAGELHG